MNFNFPFPAFLFPLLHLGLSSSALLLLQVLQYSSSICIFINSPSVPPNTFSSSHPIPSLPMSIKLLLQRGATLPPVVAPHRHLRLSLHRPYSSSSSLSSSSSSSPQSSNNPTQYSRSNFKVLPFVALFAVGTGSYVLLVKSRTGVHKPKPGSNCMSLFSVP